MYRVVKIVHIDRYVKLILKINNHGLQLSVLVLFIKCLEHF